MPINDEKQPLSLTHPELAKEAEGWDPATITAGSSQKVDWKCERGHIWTANVRNRSKLGAGCPVCCNQKVLAGFNDLQTTHPLLAKQASGWDPKTVIAGSNKKFKWKCELGHEWDAVLSSRSSGGNGCPYCSGNKVLAGFNDLQTTHPDLAKEAANWNPQEYFAGSHKKMDWKCTKGHIYKARIDHRKSGVSHCHFCSGHRFLKGFNDLVSTNPEIAEQAFGWDATDYFPQKRKLRWKCSEDHIWEATIDDRKAGNGCPSCTKSGFDPNKDGYLYFLKHSEWEMFQIGITNSPDNRLNQHKKLRWEVLELRGPMDGHLTQQWETAILRMLKAKGADLSNSEIAGKFDGYSEAWSQSTFSAKSIKELMKSTEDFEQNNFKN